MNVPVYPVRVGDELGYKSEIDVRSFQKQFMQGRRESVSHTHNFFLLLSKWVHSGQPTAFCHFCSTERNYMEILACNKLMKLFFINKLNIRPILKKKNP